MNAGKVVNGKITALYYSAHAVWGPEWQSHIKNILNLYILKIDKQFISYLLGGRKIDFCLQIFLVYVY